MKTLDDCLGLAPPDKIGHKIVERFKRWRAVIADNGSFDQWMRNFSQYHNGPADVDEGQSWSDSFSLQGDNDEVLAIRIGEMRNLVTHILNLTYSKPVGLRASAENGSAKSLEAAQIANALLEQDFETSGGNKVMRRAGEGALVVSTSFVLVEWDMMAGDPYMPTNDGLIEMAGAPRMSDLWVDEVCFDATKRDWRDVYDVILVRRRNRYELASMQPDTEEGNALRNKILNAGELKSSTLATFRWANDDSDDIVVLEYIHRGTGNPNFLPDGRRVVCLEDGEVVDDGPNPCAGLKELNVYPVTAAQGLGTAYGYAIASDLSPINRFQNLIATIIATNIAAWSSPNLTGPINKMQDVQNLVGGGRYFGVPGGQGEVKRLDLMPDLKPIVEVFEMFSRIGEKHAGIAGIMRGDEGDLSGVAIAQIKSMAIQFMNSFQQSVVEQREKVGNALIWLRKNFSRGEQKVAIVGEANMHRVATYDAAETLGSIPRIRAEAIDPVMSTWEGREARADKIMAQPNNVMTPWQYLTMLRTGRDEPMFKADMAVNTLIISENERLIKGQLPKVLKQDNHEMHEVEHLALLADPAVRESDALVQVVLEHNARHTMFRMGLTVDQSPNAPSAIDQLAQAQAQAQQSQTQPPQQGAPTQTPAPQQQGPPQGHPPPPQRAPTAQESLQQGAQGPMQ